MHQYRVTKYDPKRRDSSGAYGSDDWTSVGDIGQEFAGKLLTADQYIEVENSYIEAALRFMKEGRIESLVVSDLEDRRGEPRSGVQLVEGMSVGGLKLADVARDILRERYWCRLEVEDGFLHFGYDYYMYIGVSKPCVDAALFTQGQGLFVEVFDSPYAQPQS